MSLLRAELRDKMVERYKLRVFDFVSQMSVKPSMLKDEFTEKYFEEDNPHNKDLFNPNKCAVLTSNTKMPKINKTHTMSTTKSYINIPRVNNKASDRSTFFLPKEDSIQL